MNELTLKGKVFNLYEDKGVMYITIRVFHEHAIDGHNEWKESFFRVLVNDSVMIPPLRSLNRNEQIKVKCHLNQEYSMTGGGNKKQFIRIYADEIHTDD